MYTPEYSPELRKIVNYTFTQSDLETEYPKLKLEKLIYLLEDTEYYFEKYRVWLKRVNKDKEHGIKASSSFNKGLNAEPQLGYYQIPDVEGLAMFVLGCFYLYLIIPQSIQFQTRNKSFSIYTDLKKLYQDETNMSNVTKMVIEYINENVNTKLRASVEEETRMIKPRAFSIKKRQRATTMDGRDHSGSSISSGSISSSTSPSKNGTHLNQNTNTRHISYTPGSFGDGYDHDKYVYNEKQLSDNKHHVYQVHGNTNANAKTSSANNRIFSDNNPFKQGQTSPPMYREVGGNNINHSNSSRDEYMYNEDVYNENDNDTIEWSAPKTTSQDQLHQLNNAEAAYLDDTGMEKFPRNNKDYYRSSYIWTDTQKDNEIYDRETIQDDLLLQLLKIKNSATITPDQLFQLLEDTKKNDKLLLIDLRLQKRHMANHIESKHLLNIDPELLVARGKDYPIDSDKEFHSVMTTHLNLTDLEMLKQLNTFKYIVYYTDMRTFLNIDFDYQLKLFQFIYNASSATPKCLVGGYEQWKKFLNQKIKLTPNFNYHCYLYRAPVAKPGTPIPEHTHLPDISPSNSQIANTKMHSHLVPPSLPSIPAPPVPAKSVQNTNSISASPVPIMKQPFDDVVFRKIKRELTKNNTYPYNTSNVEVDSTLHAPVPKQPYAPQDVLIKNFEHQLKIDPKKIYRFHIPIIEDDKNEYVSLSITGLRNLGNTCYINALLQCLFEARMFRNLFLSSKYKEYFSRTYDGKYQISSSFYALFRKMYMNGGCSVIPSGFLKSCNLIRPDFNIPSTQQDSQEFLLFLLDQLHDELSNKETVLKDLPHLLLHNDQELDVDEKEYDSWFEKNYEVNGVSPVDEIFQGQIENCLQCQNCGHSAYNYSTFFVLSLAIPPPEKLSRLAYNKNQKRQKYIRLEDCINLFTGDELLSGENAWDCPRCSKSSTPSDSVSSHHERKGGRSLRSRLFKSSKSHKPAIVDTVSGNTSNGLDGTEKLKDKKKKKKMQTMKTMNFISLPHVLAIQLSRFYYDLTKKNESVITYPLILNIVLKNNTVVKYRLYGLVNHFGDLTSGHYTALVNKSLQHSIHHNSQKWYYFNDEAVKLDSTHGDFDNGFSSISSSDAYVLFYEKIED